MPVIKNNVTWKIGGLAGEGIMVTGLLFSKASVYAGLQAFDYTEYPSLIRGGHNMYLTQVSEKRIFSHDRSVEILVALDQHTIELHANEITKGGALIFDPNDKKVSTKGLSKDILLVPVPFASIATTIAANLLMRNTVALGASFALLEFPEKIIQDVLKKVFGKKSAEVVQQNIDCVHAGYEAVKAETVKRFSWKLEPKEAKGDIVITGNEAISLGAIAGGCKFYSAYPMTPASSILTYLADHALATGMVVKHAEDEISAVNMAIGAGHMGVRSMTGTAGGGFALMVEAYGMAAETETPLVIVLAQRPGPSTGLPTWTGQGDLQFALSSSQGEFPRFVAAFSDVDDCFYLTAEALSIAEEYQTPVILLTDKQLAESHQTTPKFDQSKITIRRGKRVTQKELDSVENFLRYDTDSKDGVSPRSFPGMKNGIYVANSDEHDGKGFTIEDSGPVIAMMDKRMRKIQAFEKQMPQPVLEGDNDADVTFIFWGSVKGAVKEAVKMLEAKKISSNLCCITWLSPFPSETVSRILKNAKRPVLVENNMTGQLGQLIRQQTGIELKEQILKYDGRPFFPEEIVESIMKPKHGNR